MSKAIPFDAIKVGEELGPFVMHVGEEEVRRYCEDWDDPNPLYLETSSLGGPLVPPAFMAGLHGSRLLAMKYDSRATGVTRTEHEVLRPLRVGQTMTTIGRIAEKFVKRGREYLVIESTSYDENGEVFRRSRDHILLSLERVDR
jgi:hypothetical protein